MVCSWEIYFRFIQKAASFGWEEIGGSRFSTVSVSSQSKRRLDLVSKVFRESCALATEISGSTGRAESRTFHGRKLTGLLETPRIRLHSRHSIIRTACR